MTQLHTLQMATNIIDTAIEVERRKGFYVSASVRAAAIEAVWNAQTIAASIDNARTILNEGKTAWMLDDPHDEWRGAA